MSLVDRFGIELVILGTIAILLWIGAFISIINGDTRRITKLLLLILIFTIPPIGVAYPVFKFFGRSVANDISSGKVKQRTEKLTNHVGIMGRLVGSVFGWLIKK